MPKERAVRDAHPAAAGDDSLSSGLDLAGRRVFFAGRLSSMPRRIAVRYLAVRHARVRHAVGRADVLVVGHEACILIEDGRLQRHLQRARKFDVACISENGFLRSLDLLPRAYSGVGTLNLDAVGGLSGLHPDRIRLLALFDVIEPVNGLCTFADLLAARAVARLSNAGVSLSAVVEAMVRLRRANRGRLPVSSLVGDGGAVARTIDGCIGELDGQLRLPLPETGNVAAADLCVEAERAEQEGDWDRAERLYRRGLALDRSNSEAAFNLALALWQLGRRREAKLYLALAVGINPAFAPGWYARALLLEEEGRLAEAAVHLRRAIDADPAHGDAHYTLARICLTMDEYAEAAAMWERYLFLHPDSERARRARHGLLLCRMHLQAAAREGEQVP
jgi:tetratricopeptide (TPR) repeat protein